MATSAARTAQRESSEPWGAASPPAERCVEVSTSSGPTLRSAASASAATARFTTTAIQMVTVTPIAGIRKNPARAVPTTAPQVLTA